MNVDRAATATPTSAPSVPPILSLDDPRACDVAMAGVKAASLATAGVRGLPVVDGFVVTTAACEALERGSEVPELRDAWEALTASGSRPLAVRSSSTAEDTADSSMAGRFRSVTGVSDWAELERAARAVIESRHETGEAPRPLAVLVQPHVEARVSGVMFGIDPLTGREDRVVVEVVRGAPEHLVSGEARPTHYELDRTGKVRRREDGRDGARPARREIRALAALARDVRTVFGAHQDVEWAIDGSGRLWLLQSRPVTTPARGVPAGPVMTPGPVAETFPDQLSVLEVDMWVPPLRAAIGDALVVAGAASRDAVEASPVVAEVGGRVAVDAELLGLERRGDLAARLDPRPRLRRLYSAWRVGRIRAALPHLAREALRRADATLGDVPPLAGLTGRQLVEAIARTRPPLRSLHAHEMLIGLLLDPSGHAASTSASVALRIVAAGRGEGLSDGEIVARDPVVLSLVPPSVSGTTVLPPTPESLQSTASPGDPDAALREALRLRIRWLHEFSARAAWELGARFVTAGRVQEPGDVRHLSLEELTEAVRDGRAEVRPAPREAAADHLPARFRISDKGLAIPAARGESQGGPSGVSEGVARGRVTTRDGETADGEVLVVPALDPGLATALPRVAAIVAETGSALSHVAILAREQGVPVVVGIDDATGRFRPDMVLEVDGTAGTVVVVEEEQ